MDQTHSELPEWGPLVLAHAGERLREPLSVLLRLDSRISRLLSEVSEPALGQIRLAWWREEILRERLPASSNPPDPLLSDILRHWSQDKAELAKLIDGWERLLEEEPWPDTVRQEFINGRVATFSALARMTGHEGKAEAVAAHARAWASSDLARRGNTPTTDQEALPKLPRELRALAMIGGLARRALRRGGAPMFGDRGSPFAALRLGIFGT